VPGNRVLNMWYQERGNNRRWEKLQNKDTTMHTKFSTENLKKEAKWKTEVQRILKWI
jgi:hypothetical protein